MKTVHLEIDNESLDFSRARLKAEESADAALEDPVLLSWYDRIRDRESPSGVSECHDGCEIPGCVEYAQSRGGELVVNINQGTFLFCYRNLGEFKDE